MNLTFGRPKKTTPGARFTPTSPRVDVLPAKYRERLAASRQRTIAIAVAGVVALAVGGVWGMGAVTTNDLNQQLADASDRGAELSRQLAVYAPVTNLATQTDALNDTIRSQTSSTVDHAAVLQRFLDATGAHLDVTSFQLSTASAGANGEGGAGSCVSIDPFNQAPLAGCISFTGDPKAGSSSASAVLAALQSDPWFVDPYLPALSSDGSLTGTVGLSVEALSDLGVVQQPEQGDDAAPQDDTAQDAADGLPAPEEVGANQDEGDGTAATDTNDENEGGQ